MTATTVERLSRLGSSPFPAHGTYGMAANSLGLKGTIATLDSAGRAAPPAAGQDAVGVFEQTFCNRTTDPSGGAADAIDAEVNFGVYGWLLDGSTPKPRQVVYVVDNQTVSLDAAGNRGIAGIVTEVRTINGVVQVFVYMGPHVVGAIRGGTTIDIPLGGFRLSTGAAIPTFSSGSADGFSLVDSEALALRINDDSTTVFTSSVRLPEDVPSGATVTLHVLASRVGATDTAVELLTPAVFANREGVAYDAGASLTSGNFGVIAGATKVVHELTKAITGALGGDVLTVTLAAVTANLANDDLVIHGVWISVR